MKKTKKRVEERGEWERISGERERKGEIYSESITRR
jgi:hypothetical protein